MIPGPHCKHGDHRRLQTHTGPWRRESRTQKRTRPDGTQKPLRLRDESCRNLPQGPEVESVYGTRGSLRRQDRVDWCSSDTGRERRLHPPEGPVWTSRVGPSHVPIHRSPDVSRGRGQGSSLSGWKTEDFPDSDPGTKTLLAGVGEGV